MFKRNLIVNLLIVIATSISLIGCSDQTHKDTLNKANEPKQIQAQASNATSDINAVEETFYGKWLIEKVLAYGPVGTYSNEDINKIVGKIMTFSKENASCFGDQISYLNNIAVNPTYKRTTINKNDFEINNRITFDKLGIEDDSISN